jgi:hypothetical protein
MLKNYQLKVFFTRSKLRPATPKGSKEQRPLTWH